MKYFFFLILTFFVFHGYALYSTFSFNEKDVIWFPDYYTDAFEWAQEDIVNCRNDLDVCNPDMLFLSWLLVFSELFSWFEDTFFVRGKKIYVEDEAFSDVSVDDDRLQEAILLFEKSWLPIWKHNALVLSNMIAWSDPEQKSSDVYDDVLQKEREQQQYFRKPGNDEHAELKTSLWSFLWIWWDDSWWTHWKTMKDW